MPSTPKLDFRYLQFEDMVKYAIDCIEGKNKQTIAKGTQLTEVMWANLAQYQGMFSGDGLIETFTSDDVARGCPNINKLIGKIIYEAGGIKNITHGFAYQGEMEPLCTTFKELMSQLSLMGD